MLRIVASLLLVGLPALADVRLPAILSDHMVLQRGVKVPIWGWAEPAEKVVVTFSGQSRTVTAGPDGRWQVTLDPLTTGPAATLTVEGRNKLVVDDVLVGEVWLGSGQSNMQFAARGDLGFEADRPHLNTPQIRLFAVAADFAKQPKDDCRGKWVLANEETVAPFSAVLYFFGRTLQRRLNVPVGLVNSSVGGTAIELWMPLAAQQTPELKPSLDVIAALDARFDRAAATARYQTLHAKWEKAAAAARAKGEPAPRPPAEPIAQHDRKVAIGALFNGMIAPLVPFALRGALWYQGEANSTPDRAPYYQFQMPALIRDWRTRWGQGDFPFAFVQLPNFEGPGRDWPLVREAFLKTLKVPNTGMAVTIDIGDPDNIHPKQKQEVARRLSAWALGTVYGEKGPISGPLPASFHAAHGKITVAMKYADGGLAAKGDRVRGFEIAGADNHWVPAEAVLKGQEVVVSSAAVKDPVAVRYGWSNNPDCNLYNGAGLPASPFRSPE